MSYIGRGLETGSMRQLDDISSSFDGSTTAFTMQINSVNVDQSVVGDVNQLVLSLGGVVQNPGTDFTVSGSTLTFTTAPASGLSFFCVVIGGGGGFATPGDKTVTEAKFNILDGKTIKFGTDDEVELTHDADKGLILKHTATADDKPVSLTLQTGETDMAANDVIGTVDFQAPDEGTGTDAILVAAGIAAISEGNFSSSANATKLSFKTAASEAAAEKMSLSSAGLLTVSGRIITDDATEATSTTDGSLQTDGGLSIVKDAVFGDDLKMLSDGAVIHFGADSDTTLTHTDGTGLTLNSTNKLCFNDATQFIQGASGTVLDIAATDEIELTATLLDVNANLDVSGTSLLPTLGVITAKDLGLGLHIREADSGASSVSTDADQLVIENSAESGITLLAGTSNASRLAFGDSGNQKIGMVYYNHASDYMAFSTNDTQHMKIDSAGHVTKPKQPYFRHTPTGQNDLAINQWNDIEFATEQVDENGDFATATFTAPVDGVYMFTTALYMQSIDTDFGSVEAAFHTTNDVYQIFILEPGKTFSSDSSYYSANGAVICDMDSGDTCIIKVYPAGGAAQMDINVSSTFTGGLLY